MVVCSAPAAPVLLCGYYGEHNLGDDALLAVLLQQLPRECRPLITAHDQQAVALATAAATVDRRRLRAVLAALSHCRALVLGGGSLLQDATSFNSLLYYAALIVAARMQGKPVLLWAQGLGPLRRRRSRQLVRWLLPLVSAASWRDPQSARLASALGCRHQVVGSDPVWALPTAGWKGPGGPIVLCWRPVNLLQGPGWRPYLDAVAALAEQHQRPVLWLPFHDHQDSGLLADLKAQDLLPATLARCSTSVRPQTPGEAMEVMASAALVVAMRLHGLILAAQAGAPVAALSYDPKVAAAAEGIGCPCQTLAAGEPQGLLAAWTSTFEKPPPSSRLENLRHQAQLHRAVLTGLAPGD